MADIPQDPRQLARDILSGKIKLEDLQREQARRQGAQRPAARPADDRPIPLPNLNRRENPPPPPRQVETIPVPQRQQPAPPPRQVENRQTQQRRPQSQKKVRREQPKPVRPIPPVASSSQQEGPTRQLESAPIPATTTTTQENMDTTRKVIRAAVRQPKSLRHAILLSEILQPPVSMRE